MSLSIKEGASLPPTLAMAVMVASVHDAFKEAGYDCVITAGIDGKHSAGSLHYVGLALDFRSRTIPSGLRQEMRDKIAKRLGSAFDVVLEDDHYHIELQPKLPIGATA
jgi:hypothetical protein